MRHMSEGATDTVRTQADIAADTHAYLRLATIDLPVLRSLVVELRRVSDESAALAVRESTVEAAVGQAGVPNALPRPKQRGHWPRASSEACPSSSGVPGDG